MWEFVVELLWLRNGKMHRVGPAALLGASVSLFTALMLMLLAIPLYLHSLENFEIVMSDVSSLPKVDSRRV